MDGLWIRQASWCRGVRHCGWSRRQRKLNLFHSGIQNFVAWACGGAIRSVSNSLIPPHCWSGSMSTGSDQCKSLLTCWKMCGWRSDTPKKRVSRMFIRIRISRSTEEDLLSPQALTVWGETWTAVYSRRSLSIWRRETIDDNRYHDAMQVPSNREIDMFPRKFLPVLQCNKED